MNLWMRSGHLGTRVHNAYVIHSEYPTYPHHLSKHVHSFSAT